MLVLVWLQYSLRRDLNVYWLRTMCTDLGRCLLWSDLSIIWEAVWMCTHLGRYLFRFDLSMVWEEVSVCTDLGRYLLRSDLSIYSLRRGLNVYWLTTMFVLVWFEYSLITGLNLYWLRTMFALVWLEYSLRRGLNVYWLTTMFVDIEVTLLVWLGVNSNDYLTGCLWCFFFLACSDFF